MALLDVRALTKRFPVRGTPHWLYAVDDVSFTIERGESVGLVGESGCGKSTVARLITRLLDATDGRIVFDGRDIGAIPPARFTRVAERRLVQMVFQDPAESLNPRFTAADTIAEPIRRLGTPDEKASIAGAVEELAELVGLPGELLGRFPHQLSGGQQQRVSIARAIALRPSLLVLDEPTSALDVSVQAVILHLLADLRARLGMSYLFVSHALNVVRLLTDRVLVMYLGKIVEAGPADEVLGRSAHPYTRALMSAVPVFETGAPRPRISLVGEPRGPIDPLPNVCRFYGRCPEGFDRCAHEAPVLRAGPGDDHFAACHLAFREPAVGHPVGR